MLSYWALFDAPDAYRPTPPVQVIHEPLMIPQRFVTATRDQLQTLSADPRVVVASPPLKCPRQMWRARARPFGVGTALGAQDARHRLTIRSSL